MRRLARTVVTAIAAALLLPNAALAAAPAPPAGPAPDPAKRVEARLYPLVVPESYLPYSNAVAEGLARPLGHGLHVILAFDLDGLVGNATATDLARLGLLPDQARARALENLERLAQAETIRMVRFETKSGHPFVLAGDHWAAATAILLPRLREVVAAAVGTKALCASIPHREALLVFPCGDRASRDEMRALIREHEADGRKPLTWELFELTDGGVKPLAGR